MNLAGSLLQLLGAAARADTTVAGFAADIIAAARQHYRYGRAALFVLEAGEARALTEVAPLDRLRVEAILTTAATGGDVLRSDIAAVQAGDGSTAYLLVAWARERRRPPTDEEALDGLRILVRLFANFMNRQSLLAGSVDSAQADGLTGLPNRRAVVVTLENAIEHARRSGDLAALFYIDLDGFKSINDMYGHAMGDAVLTEIASRLRRASRRTETVGRFGGDEFAAVVPDLHDGAEAVELGHRLLQALAEPIPADGISVRVGASIGIVLCPLDGDNPHDLLAAADAAMYRAKRSGGNQVFLYGDKLRAEVETRRRLNSDLRNATFATEFIVCYQPVVDGETGAVIGAEAFARWLHPRDGVLTAATFLDPVSGSLGTALDTWILGEAVRQISSWQRKSRHAIYVNIATPDPVLFAEYDRVTAGAPASLQLRLEMDETAIAKNIEACVAFSTECAARGIEFGIDHFGVAPPQLRMLERLRPAFVKLDRSLMSGVDLESEQPSAAFAAIRLAQAFELDVIAQGVTRLKEQHWLLQRGVRTIQGYGVAAPMTAVDFEQWMAFRSGSRVQSGVA